MNFAHAIGGGRGYGSDASLASLRELHALGVRSVTVMPFGFQRRASDTKITWVGNEGRWIDESDSAVAGSIAQAHGLGMSVMLKPHLWLRPPDWPGSIDHATDAEWHEWFTSYRAFILHYAELAQKNNVEMLCIGNELTHSSKHDHEWRAVIAAVRSAYKGKLTYGANISEVFDVPFWDALDFIGVSAYFPLSQERQPSEPQLAKAWQPVVARLGALSAKTRRRIIFTELGYASRDFAAASPWEEGGGAVNVCAQADAYQAFFDAVWRQPWLEGVYWWKWESYPRHTSSERADFLIENRPAADVVRRNFVKQF